MKPNTLNFDVLHNFISPVTGRVLAPTNYVLLGDAQGIATPSPLLIDLKNDYDILVTADFIVGHPNDQIPNAQVLVDMVDGFLYNTAGIVSTTPTIPIGSLPDLLYHNIWIGDITNRPVATQRIDVLNLPPFLDFSSPTALRDNFGLYNLYTASLIPSNIPPTSAADLIPPATTLRIHASNMANLTVGKMWMGVKNIIPPGITIDLVPPYVHINGNLNWDPLGAVSDSFAVPTEVGLNPGYIFMGSKDPLKFGQIVASSIIIDIEDAIATIEEEILAIEDAITTIEGEIIAIEASITTIEGEILLIQGELDIIWGTLYTPVTGLVSVVADHTADIATLFARTLDQVPLAIASVNLNNNRIINLSDPIGVLDAVNLQTLQSHVAAAVTSVTGTASQITATPTTGAVVLSLPASVVLATSIAAGNMRMFANAIQSTNTNGSISLFPNGTGQVVILSIVNMNNNRIGNLANPAGALDAVNLQTLQSHVAAAVTSVTGTASQITATPTTGAVVLSLPASVVISTSLTAGNLRLSGNILSSTNANGNVNVVPDGVGDVVMGTSAAATTYTRLASGSLYMQANLITNTMVANIYQKIAGTTTSAQLNKFTMPANNRLQYGGTPPIVANISVRVAFNVSVATTVGVALYKNGVVIPNSPFVQTYRSATGTPVEYIGTDAFTSMVSTDYIEAYIMTTNNSTLTASYLILTITTT